MTHSNEDCAVMWRVATRVTIVLCAAVMAAMMVVAQAKAHHNAEGIADLTPDRAMPDYHVQTAPNRYKKPDIKVRYKGMSFADLQTRCNATFTEVMACAAVPLKMAISRDGYSQVRDYSRECVIYLPNDMPMPSKTFQKFVAHEQAHCNGWPADHPRR